MSSIGLEKESPLAFLKNNAITTAQERGFGAIEPRYGG
jgi:hypothetical protein